MSTPKDKITALLKNGKTKHAIETLSNFYKEDVKFQNFITVISGEFNDLEERLNSNSLTTKEFTSEKNSINIRLLDSLEKLKPGIQPDPDEEVEIIKKSRIERLCEKNKKRQSKYLKSFLVCIGLGLVLIIVAQVSDVDKYWLGVGGIVFIMISLPSGYYYRKDYNRARGYEDLLEIIADQDYIKKPGSAYDIWWRLMQIE